MVLLGSIACAQSIPVDLSITVGDGTGKQQVLRFGLAPTATNGIDTALGESERPPLPPSGVFDARFVGSIIKMSLGEGVLRDYRFGDSATPTSCVHQLRYQCGTGTQIALDWDLPTTVHGRLQDVYTGALVDVAMTGKGGTIVTNPGVYSTLKMTVEYSGVTGWAEETPGSKFALSQNFPNPFNPSTRINFSVESEGTASLKVFNILGEEVAALFEGIAEPGRLYSCVFTGEDLASGVYVAHMRAGQNTAMVKMLLIR